MLISSPKETRRLFSKPIRLLIRCFAAVFCVGVAFIPMALLSDTNWLVMLVIVLMLACVIEWVGRFRKRPNKDF